MTEQRVGIESAPTPYPPSPALTPIRSIALTGLFVAGTYGLNQLFSSLSGYSRLRTAVPSALTIASTLYLGKNWLVPAPTVPVPDRKPNDPQSQERPARTRHFPPAPPVDPQDSDPAPCGSSDDDSDTRSNGNTDPARQLHPGRLTCPDAGGTATRFTNCEQPVGNQTPTSSKHRSSLQDERVQLFRDPATTRQQTPAARSPGRSSAGPISVAMTDPNRQTPAALDAQPPTSPSLQSQTAAPGSDRQPPLTPPNTQASVQTQQPQPADPITHHTSDHESDTATDTSSEGVSSPGAPLLPARSARPADTSVSNSLPPSSSLQSQTAAPGSDRQPPLTPPNTQASVQTQQSQPADPITHHTSDHESDTATDTSSEGVSSPGAPLLPARSARPADTSVFNSLPLSSSLQSQAAVPAPDRQPPLTPPISRASVPTQQPQPADPITHHTSDHESDTATDTSSEGVSSPGAPLLPARSARPADTSVFNSLPLSSSLQSQTAVPAPDRQPPLTPPISRASVPTQQPQPADPITHHTSDHESDTATDTSSEGVSSPGAPLLPARSARPADTSVFNSLPLSSSLQSQTAVPAPDRQPPLTPPNTQASVQTQQSQPADSEGEEAEEGIGSEPSPSSQPINAASQALRSTLATDGDPILRVVRADGTAFISFLREPPISGTKVLRHVLSTAEGIFGAFSRVAAGLTLTKIYRLTPGEESTCVQEFTFQGEVTHLQLVQTGTGNLVALMVYEKKRDPLDNQGHAPQMAPQEETLRLSNHDTVLQSAVVHTDNPTQTTRLNSPVVAMTHDPSNDCILLGTQAGELQVLQLAEHGQLTMMEACSLGACAKRPIALITVQSSGRYSIQFGTDDEVRYVDSSFIAELEQSDSQPIQLKLPDLSRCTEPRQSIACPPVKLTPKPALTPEQQTILGILAANLPNELLCEIFRHLSSEDLVRSCRLVQRSWWAVVNEIEAERGGRLSGLRQRCPQALYATQQSAFLRTPTWQCTVAPSEVYKVTGPVRSTVQRGCQPKTVNIKGVTHLVTLHQGPLGNGIRIVNGITGIPLSFTYSSEIQVGYVNQNQAITGFDAYVYQNTLYVVTASPRDKQSQFRVRAIDLNTLQLDNGYLRIFKHPIEVIKLYHPFGKNAAPVVLIGTTSDTGNVSLQLCTTGRSNLTATWSSDRTSGSITSIEVNHGWRHIVVGDSQGCLRRILCRFTDKNTYELNKTSDSHMLKGKKNIEAVARLGFVITMPSNSKKALFAAQNVHTVYEPKNIQGWQASLPNLNSPIRRVRIVRVSEHHSIMISLFTRSVSDTRDPSDATSDQIVYHSLKRMEKDMSITLLKRETLDAEAARFAQCSDLFVVQKDRYPHSLVLLGAPESKPEEQELRSFSLTELIDPETRSS